LALERAEGLGGAVLGRLSITVNAASPGLIQTEMLTDAAVQAYLPLVPLGRVGLQSEVAHVIRYPCSEEAGFVTGPVIGINGGLWI
jgi:3-oxoacyl-[acyl-carrier protein] reductase